METTSIQFRMPLIKLYAHPALDSFAHKSKLHSVRQCDIQDIIVDIETEFCYYIQQPGDDVMPPSDSQLLRWMLGRPCVNVDSDSCFDAAAGSIIEIGARLHVSTPYSTNAVSICRAVGLSINRLERSLRYRVISSRPLSADEEEAVTNVLCDRMTEKRYPTTLSTLSCAHDIQPWYYVNIDTQGLAALEQVNRHLGLALDAADLNYYFHLFRNVLD